MARVMYFDAFSGAAGDMVLGALIDAGLPVEALKQALGSLGADHELRVSRVLRSGLSATHVSVSGPAERVLEHAHAHDAHHHHGHHHHQHHHHGDGHDHHHNHGAGHDHHHAHDHGHAHEHRTLAEIAHLIQHSALSPAAQARAVGMFRRLAEAEASIHDMSVDQVHLHEVGALDSIIDIVGAAFAFEWFGIDDVVSSPLNVGGGTVRIAHGEFPVPAPATVRVLGDAPIYSRGPEGELVTPTGALVISTYAKSYGGVPPMTVERIGYGAGTRDVPGRPNVLRVMIGERRDGSSADARTSVVKIECEIDDMNPQLFGPVADRLHEAGALDVFLTPIYMKKGRPGTLLTVLAAPADRSRLCDVVFRETTSIGVRFEAVEREVLDRRWVDVAVDGGTVRVKVATRNGEVLNAIAEFDDCLRVATSTGRPVKLVQAEVMRAWSALGST